MRKIACVLMVVLGLAVAGCGGFSPEWNGYKSDSLGVSLDFPGAPKEDSVDDLLGAPVEPASEGASGTNWPQRQCWSFEVGDMTASAHVNFVYSHGDIPESLTSVAAPAVLEKVRAAVLHDLDAKGASASREVTRDGLSGIKFEHEVPGKGKRHWECFVADGKVVILRAYIFGKAEVDPARFFESFKRSKK